ncbi:hypothetical protein, partial [Latilactobacillus sakei]|uniref:hypothetical protein n=1 Tax=Latilactobacillus sakei TaxID=1599 RepID=UPI0039AFEED4
DYKTRANLSILRTAFLILSSVSEDINLKFFETYGISFLLSFQYSGNLIYLLFPEKLIHPTSFVVWTLEVLSDSCIEL